MLLESQVFRACHHLCAIDDRGHRTLDRRFPPDRTSGLRYVSDRNQPVVRRSLWVDLRL